MTEGLFPCSSEQPPLQIRTITFCAGGIILLPESDPRCLSTNRALIHPHHSKKHTELRKKTHTEPCYDQLISKPAKNDLPVSEFFSPLSTTVDFGLIGTGSVSDFVRVRGTSPLCLWDLRGITVTL